MPGRVSLYVELDRAVIWHAFQDGGRAHQKKNERNRTEWHRLIHRRQRLFTMRLRRRARAQHTLDRCAYGVKRCSSSSRARAASLGGANRRLVDAQYAVTYFLTCGRLRAQHHLPSPARLGHDIHYGFEVVCRQYMRAERDKKARPERA